jgi:hypothetical protein
MFGFLKKLKAAKAAQVELTIAFRTRGHNFMKMDSTVHEALVKEALVTGAVTTMQHFDRIELLYLGGKDSIVDYYRKRSKTF